jgi:hypothetical protein
MSSARSPRLRAVAAAAFAGAWLACIMGSGGCEVAVGDTVPAFACDPGADTCPNGQVCSQVSHECVPSCAAGGCKAGMQCDPTSNLCEPVDSAVVTEATVADTYMAPDFERGDTADSGQVQQDTSVPPPDTSMTTDAPGPCRALGCSCAGASACDSGICADALTVTSGLYMAAGNANFCTQPCCTSADCGAGTVCFATGQGGDYCVNPGWIGRVQGLGAGQGGASCGTGENCRSGLCDTNSMTCIDTCCSSGSASTDCATGQTCQFDAFPGATSIDKNYSAFCAVPVGTHTDGQTCNNGNIDCQSNLCASFPPDPTVACRGACRSTSDCGANEDCEYILPPGQTANPMPIVAACAPPQGTGMLAEGAACNTTNDDCQGFCDPNTSLCTDVCFANSDCTMTTWRCRPETVPVSGGGSYSVLCCGS